MLTLRETLIFPLTTLPLAVGREASLRAVEEASRGARQLVLLAQKQSDTEEPWPADLYTAGHAGARSPRRPLPRRHPAGLGAGPRAHPRPRVRGRRAVLAGARQRIPERQETPTPEVEALARNALESFARLVAVSPFLPDELVNRGHEPGQPVGSAVPDRLEPAGERAGAPEVLEIDGLQPKYERVQALLEREIELLELGHKLRGQVQERVDKGQREFFLREQLKAIQQGAGRGRSAAGRDQRAARQGRWPPR